MQAAGVTKALDAYMRSPAARRLRVRQRARVARNSDSSSPWPARPARTPGETTCNTRCINGSCWRTYDNGRHVHLNVPPTMDPFSGQMQFNPPPC